MSGGSSQALRQSQEEMLVALQALNQVSNDHPEWLQPPDLSDPSKEAPEAYTILRTSL
jgi:hypothetical protein